jgi:hypothetical protein
MMKYRYCPATGYFQIVAIAGSYLSDYGEALLRFA